MKRTKLILSSFLLFLVLLGGFSAVNSASGGGNRCTDRCADRYRIEKDACKSIPFKHERHLCEDVAKRKKKECKHRCR